MFFSYSITPKRNKFEISYMSILLEILNKKKTKHVIIYFAEQLFLINKNY